MGAEVIYSIVDGKGKQSTTEINLPTSVSLADAILFAQEMAKLLDALIDGRVTRIGLGFLVALPGSLKAVAGANSDVEEGARFQFRTAGNYFTGLRLPTFDEQYILPNTDTVDQVSAPTAAFINAMRSGINLTGVGGSGTIQPADKRGDDITTLEFAREQFLRTRGRTD